MSTFPRINLNWTVSPRTTADAADEKRVPATVPGAVQLDWAKAHGWGDHWYADNWKRYGGLEDKFWSYKATLDAAMFETLKPGEKLYFVCKGVDYRYEIRLGDKLFAGYVTNFNGTPIVYPIVGPTGKYMTRGYPMQENYEGVRADHPNHRSLWFTHGDVNKFDHWGAEGSEKIVHKRFAKAERDGNTALLVTENDWVDDKGKLLCRDVRTIRFAVAENMRIIDFDVTVTAEQDKVVFGDTKEGNFGIRVPEAIAVVTGKGGRFVNAEGKVGEKEAWGKRSTWVNYHGTIDSEKVGIAILNHPSSFRFPTYWHVRDYGLFAANPFGVHDFEGLQYARAGELTLSKGESITFRYRVLFHKDADIAEAYKVYSAKP